MTRTRHLILIASALVALAAGCGDGTDDSPDPGPAAEDDRWADIDTSAPSEDPVATVYGYVQAMADGDEDRACSFQYRGSSDYDPDPCVLADEMPRRDQRFAAEDWATFAEFALGDYEAREDGGWTVSLPTEPATAWRITQNDAGIWYVERSAKA